MEERRFKRHQVALGNEIRNRREALGFSQESFAAEVGVHRTYLGAIERGERNPSLRNLLRIAEALDCSLSELFAGSESDERTVRSRKETV